MLERLNVFLGGCGDKGAQGGDCVIIIFLPSVSIPEGGLKIDENKLKGYDAHYYFFVPTSTKPRA